MFFEVLMICLIFQFLRAPMHKVQGISSRNRKHTPPLLFTFYKMFVLRFHFAFTESQSTALLFSFVLVL